MIRFLLQPCFNIKNHFSLEVSVPGRFHETGAFLKGPGHLLPQRELQRSSRFVGKSDLPKQEPVRKSRPNTNEGRAKLHLSHQRYFRSR